MQTAVHERLISLAGCGNFRDLGGYETRDGRRVRWRRVFRSDALVWLTDEDVKTLQAMGLNLVFGIDLRTHDELEMMRVGPVYESDTRHHHLPFFPRFGEDRKQVQAAVHSIGQVASDSYLRLMEQSKPCFEGVFTLLADPAHYPSAYYCAAGKDRTGMVSALLLRVLGVSDEQIIEDYALTAPPSEERMIARFKAMGRDVSELPDPASLAASPETMEHFLAGFDRLHGSVEEFLLSCNLRESILEQVRQNLLED
jgi:protein-tyrosine phosphatase